MKNPYSKIKRLGKRVLKMVFGTGYGGRAAITQLRIIIDNGRPVRAIRPKEEKLLYDAVNIDINNTCNLRCRFCFNVFDEKHYYMTPEMFGRILPILPLTRDADTKGNGVYLSCLYEPSLSPYFLEILGMLPESARDKVFFTSNFCRPWTSEQLSKILDANLHHINISVETLKEERYEEITTSKHFQSFYKNIHELAGLYSEKQGYKPKLRYITMILKLNRDEIIDLVKYCSEKLHSSQHELRTPYISVYKNMEWNREQLMPPEECSALKAELEALWCPTIMDIHSRNELVVEDPSGQQADGSADAIPKTVKKDWFGEAEEAEINLCMNREFFFLRFHPDGTCSENVTGYLCGIPDSENAGDFYMDKLKSLAGRRNNAFCCTKTVDMNDAGQADMVVKFDHITAKGAMLGMDGWVKLKEEVPGGVLLMAAVSGDGSGEVPERKLYYTQMIPRPNIQQEENCFVTGFSVSMDRMSLPGTIRLTFMLVARENGKAIYTHEFRYPIVVR